MSSFEETKAIQILSHEKQNFINYNRRNLSRIYPKGTRLFSSNFDPLPLWLVGCQMVALNYQSKDHRLMYSRAMFRQNGRCGYVLKPLALRGLHYLITTKCIFAQNFDHFRNEQILKPNFISEKRESRLKWSVDSICPSQMDKESRVIS